MASVSEEGWTGFHFLPAATQATLHGLLGKLRKQNVSKMTILLLGRGGVGKSSIINSFFSERVAAVSAFQSETLRPCLYSRSRDDFKLNIIDTPSLFEAGCVNEEALASIRRYLVGKTIDAVLYVDRLDGPREDQLHKKLIRAVSQAFGRQVPFVLVESSNSCCVNAEHEKIVPDGQVWLPVLFGALVDLITGPNQSMVVDEKVIGASKDKRLGNIWMPLALLAQFVLIWRPIRKAIERDLSEETQQLPSWELQAEQPHPEQDTNKG